MSWGFGADPGGSDVMATGHGADVALESCRARRCLLGLTSSSSTKDELLLLSFPRSMHQLVNWVWIHLKVLLALLCFVRRVHISGAALLLHVDGRKEAVWIHPPQHCCGGKFPSIAWRLNHLDLAATPSVLNYYHFGFSKYIVFAMHIDIYYV